MASVFVPRHFSPDALKTIFQFGRLPLPELLGDVPAETVVVGPIKLWVSDRPLDANEGAWGDTLLALEVPISVFEEYEWPEEGRGYRESLIPATTLNELGSGIGVVEEDE
jgi:hypothetical protein